jgi:hypothetical protein
VVVAVLLLVGVAGGSTPPCCAPMPPGLVSWWPANGDGTDMVGAHNATLDGGAGFAAGEVGQGFAFDSVDDLVRASDNADFIPGTDSFTVDAWIRTTTGANEVVIRHYECAGFCPTNQANGDWDLRVLNHVAFGFIRDDSGAGPDSGGQNLSGTSAVDDGAFHHVALVRDMAAGKARLYVDGQLQNEQPLGPGSNGAITSLDGEDDPVTIGGGWLGGTTDPDANVAFTGVIDEVDWWRTALTGSQIAAIAAAGANGKCTDELAPVSAATAPASGRAGSPITISYTASDNVAVARVNLLVRTPGAGGFTEVASNASSASSGTFTYTPTTAGDYGFATTAEDANCGREAAPADPDAVTHVAAATVTPPPTPGAAPKQVPITQIATLPSARACVSRRHFRIHLRNHGLHPLKATVFVNGTAVKVIKGRHLAADIDLRGLPKGRVKVRLTISYRGGKTLTGVRTYHTCTARKHEATHHEV